MGHCGESKKRNIKAKKTILDAAKYHIIPHVSGKNFAFQMWQSLCSLYRSPNQNRKMVLQKKFRVTKMTKTDLVASFLTRFACDKMGHYAGQCPNMKKK
jgi:hypothetical protein